MLSLWSDINDEPETNIESAQCGLTEELNVDLNPIKTVKNPTPTRNHFSRMKNLAANQNPNKPTKVQNTFVSSNCNVLIKSRDNFQKHLKICNPLTADTKYTEC